MKFKPIIFNGEMVRAILSGRKTQTRRLIDPQPQWETAGGFWIVEKKNKSFWWNDDCHDSALKHCPYQIGDRLYVRETWAVNPVTGKFVYRATDSEWEGCWKPSIHMPREASRITLVITDVRVERLQDISEEAAIAEGVSPMCPGLDYANRELKRAFQSLWDSTYGTWDDNPWVWVIEFAADKSTMSAIAVKEDSQ